MNLLSKLTQPISWLTGAQKGEQKRVILAFLALLCLLISYYLLKPLRNSKFLEEFHPSYLPFVYVCSAILSFGVTKLFTQLARTVEKYRLVTGAYVVIIMCKLGLGYWLQVGGRAPVVFFYFFVSVYFLLAIATMWACINDIFTTDQGERCFGFIALGGTLGGIAGSQISNEIARSAYHDKALFFSIGFMVVALALVMTAARIYRLESAPEMKSSPETTLPLESESSEGEPQKDSAVAPAEKEGFWREVRALIGRPYLRRIALSVMCLAIANTSFEFLSQATIDRELAQQQYNISFTQLEGIPFDELYTLRSQAPEVRTSEFERLAEINGISPDEVSGIYNTFRTELEIETRSFFSVTYYYQGILGIFLLLVVARILFPRVGMRYCYVILPTIAFVGLVLLGFTADLLLVQGLLIVFGSVNYSLNNATKEVLYTVTDEETLFRFKPMIEGPCMRTGDVLNSLLKLFMGAITAWLMLDDLHGNMVYLVVILAISLVWMRVTWLAGKEYDERTGSTK